jgi:hypothetical protein
MISLSFLPPLPKIEEMLLKKNLLSDNIIQTSLASSLNPHSFELTLNKHLVGLLKTEGMALTKKKKSVYVKFEYLCYDKVHIPSNKPTNRSKLTVSTKMR